MVAIAIYGSGKKTFQRVEEPVAFNLIHEVLDAVIDGDTAASWATYTTEQAGFGTSVREWRRRLGVEFEEPRMGIGLWGGGAPYTETV